VLIRTVFALAIFFLPLSGCIKEEPFPPEVKLAETQELDLRRAGAPPYLQEPYSRYRDAFDKAKSSLIQGRYQILGKKPSSRYEKVLFIDYPNETD
jgi:hypothetical protein